MSEKTKPPRCCPNCGYIQGNHRDGCPGSNWLPHSKIPYPELYPNGQTLFWNRKTDEDDVQWVCKGLHEVSQDCEWEKIGMRLARIEHFRCGEPIYRHGGGYTYVWVPDDMDELELEALCNKAQKSYLDTERTAKAATPVVPPGYGATFHPDVPDTKTVGELKAEYETLSKAYKEYQAAMDISRKPFAYWLKLYGEGRVKQFWEESPALNVELNWGHNHGLVIDHSPTKINDYPFPEDDGEDDL